MPQLSDDIESALGELDSDSRKRINRYLAEQVLKVVFDKRTRIRDGGVAIKYSLTECNIGKQGTREMQQKSYRAYWRLTRKILDIQDRRARKERGRQ